MNYVHIVLLVFLVVCAMALFAFLFGFITLNQQ